MENNEKLSSASGTENISAAESASIAEKNTKKPWKKTWIYRILMAVFAVTFLVSAGFLAKYFINSARQNDIHNDLSDLVNQNRPTVSGPSEPTDPTDPTNPSNPVDASDPTEPTNATTPSEPTNPPTVPTPPPYAVLPDVLVTIKHPDTGKDMQILQEYAPIFEKNTDLVGWITVPGTKVDYPVLQTPSDPHYYLYRDFYKKDSIHGSIYANGPADINKPSDNITIYGHRMNDYSMFYTLLRFKVDSFCDENRYIYFDTLTEHHVYEIVSAFQTTAAPGTGFVYHTFVDGSEAKFDQFVSKCKQLSWFDFGVDAVYGDKLITLSTCDHAINQGRWVVVAKRIT